MLRQFRIVAVAITVLAAAGCGIKGPLYLPPPTPPPVVKPDPAAAPAVKPDPAAAPATAPGANPVTPDPAAPARKP